MAFEGFLVAPHLLFTNYFSLHDTIQELYYYLTTTTTATRVCNTFSVFLLSEKLFALEKMCCTCWQSDATSWDITEFSSFLENVKFISWEVREISLPQHLQLAWTEWGFNYQYCSFCAFLVAEGAAVQVLQHNLG